MVHMPIQLREVTDDSSSDDEDIQLFSFNATTNINNGGGRPKRKLKAIARFESLTFDQKKSSSQCKIGEGFSCPRCSAECSYDCEKCEDCDLECCYEAGIGVVVLKERTAINLYEEKKEGREW